MKRLLMWFLFFFCFFSMTGCRNMKEQMSLLVKNEKEKENQYKSETIGKVSDETEEESERILVLVYGDEMMTGIAASICEAIGAVCYPHSADENKIKNAMMESDYLLLGTDREVIEWEFSLKQCLGGVELKDKKIALFLLNQTEKAEQYETKIVEWFPGIRLLPTFTMEKTENIQNELGRMNGWLTTVLTYGEIPK